MSTNKGRKMGSINVHPSEMVSDVNQTEELDETDMNETAELGISTNGATQDPKTLYTGSY